MTAMYWENLVAGIPHYLQPNKPFKFRAFKKELKLLRQLGGIYGFSKSSIIQKDSVFSRILGEVIGFLRWVFNLKMPMEHPNSLEFFERLMHLLHHPHHRNKDLRRAFTIAAAYQALIDPVKSLRDGNLPTPCMMTSSTQTEMEQVLDPEPETSQFKQVLQAEQLEKSNLAKILASERLRDQAVSDTEKKSAVDQKIVRLNVLRQKNYRRFIEKNPGSLMEAKEIFDLTEEELVEFVGPRSNLHLTLP